MVVFARFAVSVLLNVVVFIAGQRQIRVAGVLTSSNWTWVADEAKIALNMWKSWVDDSNLPYTVEFNFTDAEDEDDAVSQVKLWAAEGDDKADVIIAPYGSAWSQAVIKALVDETTTDVPVMVWGDNDPEIFTAGHPNVFGVQTTLDKYYDEGLKALQEKGAEKVLFIQDGSQVGTISCPAARLFANSLNMTSLPDGSNLMTTGDTEDVTTKISALGDITVDVVLICGTPTTAQNIVKTLPDIASLKASSIFTSFGERESFKNNMMEDGPELGRQRICGVLSPVQWANIGEQEDPVLKWTPQHFSDTWSELWLNDTGKILEPTVSTAAAGAVGVALANAIQQAIDDLGEGGSMDMPDVVAKLKSLDIPSFWGKLRWEGDGTLGDENKVLMTQNQQLPDREPAGVVVAPDEMKQANLRFPVTCPRVLRVGGPLQTDGEWNDRNMGAKHALGLWSDEVFRMDLDYIIKLNFQDVGGESSDDTLATIARNMSDNGEVDFLITPPSSSSAKAVVAAMGDSETPVMVWSGIDSGIFEQGERATNAFGFIAVDKTRYNNGLLALSEASAESVLLITDGTPIMNQACEGAKETAEGLGMSVSEIQMATDGSNIEEVLGGLGSLSVDVAIVFSSTNALLSVVRGFPNTTVSPTTIFAEAADDEAFKQALGESGEGHLFCGLLGIEQWVSLHIDVNDDVIQWTDSIFADKFETRSGLKPTEYSAAAGAVGVALSNAILNAGSKATVQEIAAKMKDLDILSFFGPIKFNADGSSGNPTVVIQNQLGYMGAMPASVYVAPEFGIPGVKKTFQFPDTCARILRVGGPLQSSGLAEEMATQGRVAFEFWRDELNALGLGYVIETHFVDVATPDEAVKEAKRLVDNGDVDILISPVGTMFATMVSEELKESDTPVMVWAARDSGIWDKPDVDFAKNTFGFMTLDKEFYHSGLDALFDAGARTLLLITDGTSISNHACEGAKQQALSLGMTLPVDMQTVEKNGNLADAKKVLDGLDSLSVDVLLVCPSNVFSVVPVVRALPDTQVKAGAIFSSVMADEEFKEAMKTQGSEDLLCGLVGSVQWVPSGNFGQDDVVKWTTQNFIDKFTEKTGSTPVDVQAAATTVGIALANAIKATGKSGTFNLDMVSIITELKALNIKTFYGDVKFSDQGGFFLTGKPVVVTQNQLGTGAGGESASVSVAPAQIEPQSDLLYPDTCPESGGGPSPSPVPAPGPPPKAPSTGGNNAVWWILGIILVVVALGAIAFVVVNSGNKSPRSDADTELAARP